MIFDQNGSQVRGPKGGRRRFWTAAKAGKAAMATYIISLHKKR
jgi:hypothetical protein